MSLPEPAGFQVATTSVANLKRPISTAQQHLSACLSAAEALDQGPIKTT